MIKKNWIVYFTQNRLFRSYDKSYICETFQVSNLRIPNDNFPVIYCASQLTSFKLTPWLGLGRSDRVLFLPTVYIYRGPANRKQFSKSPNIPTDPLMRFTCHKSSFRDENLQNFVTARQSISLWYYLWSLSSSSFRGLFFSKGQQGRPKLVRINTQNG